MLLAVITILVHCSCAPVTAPGDGPAWAVRIFLEQDRPDSGQPLGVAVSLVNRTSEDVSIWNVGGVEVWGVKADGSRVQLYPGGPASRPEKVRAPGDGGGAPLGVVVVVDVPFDELHARLMNDALVVQYTGPLSEEVIPPQGSGTLIVDIPPAAMRPGECRIRAVLRARGREIARSVDRVVSVGD